jgi:hypothetical protein
MDYAYILTSDNSSFLEVFLDRKKAINRMHKIAQENDSKVEMYLDMDEVYIVDGVYTADNAYMVDGDGETIFLNCVEISK